MKFESSTSYAPPFAALLREAETDRIQDRDVEALDLIPADELGKFIDDAWAGVPSVVGDGSLRRVFGFTLWKGMMDGRALSSEISDDDLLTVVLGESFNLLLDFKGTKMTRDVRGLRGFLDKALHNVIVDELVEQQLMPRSYKTAKGEVRITRPAKGEGGELSLFDNEDERTHIANYSPHGPSTESRKEAFDMADAFHVFFQKLDIQDRLILLPTYVAEHLDEWPYYMPYVTQQYLVGERAIRDRPLSDLHDVETSAISARRKFLLDTFTMFLEEADVTCNFERPKWFDRASVAPRHRGGTGSSDSGPHPGTSDAATGGKTKRHKPSQGKPKNCAVNRKVGR